VWFSGLCDSFKLMRQQWAMFGERTGDRCLAGRNSCEHCQGKGWRRRVIGQLVLPVHSVLVGLQFVSPREGGCLFVDLSLRPFPAQATAAADLRPGCRKLSGAFLACMKLRARVPCRDLFFNTFNNYNFDGEDPAASSDDADVPHTATA